jgi:predicted DsbA family dithiol-disulfide isomerase
MSSPDSPSDAALPVEIWSDLHCPWALVAIHRLRTARRAHGLDVVFVPRAWPLEWVNSRGTPREIVTTEVAALASHEPDLFSAYRGESWPSTFLPAFELVAATRRVHGVVAAEEVDYALRLAFFRDSVDVSIAAGLERALESAASTVALDPEAVMDMWRESDVRSDIVADYRESRRITIQGSPQITWPDGSNDHNPGMTDHEWHGGLVRIMRTDRRAPERRLLEVVHAVREAESPPDGIETADEATREPAGGV